MSNTTLKLEAVYYASPIPASKMSLTFLAVVFDKIHFPDVYLPIDGFDAKEALKEANRIEALKLKDYETVLLVGTLRCLPLMTDLKEFCHFTGNSNSFGVNFSPETTQLVNALETEVFGPRPTGFTPIFETRSCKGLPGSDASIIYPGSLFYPANAMVYAAQHALPLINDNRHLPVPAFSGKDAMHNTKLLATIMAMECIKVALPNVRPLTPREIVELRAELSKDLILFRQSLLGLAAELNRQISQNASYEEIMRAAKFIAETQVEPSLAELRASLERSGSDWYKRTYDLVKEVPALATMYATMPKEIAIAKALAMFGGVFQDIRATSNGKNEAAKSGMYYLLRMQDTMRK